MRKIKIAPSILSADFSKMGEEIKRINEAKCDMIHCDVMDGMFVKNITFGPKMIADIKKHTNLMLDTHMMVVEPERYVDDFIKAGSDMITIHYEACKCIKETLEKIKSKNVKCGIVLNPDTPIEKCFEFLPLCDMVLLMSVYPGFGGQSFIEDVFDKITNLRKYINENNLNIELQVDGGVTIENAKKVINCGADVLVAGSALFNADDMNKAVEKLREA